MASDTETTTVDGLALLPLPALDGLTEQQVRGLTCVWDGVPLTTDTAVDLGPRRMKRLDGDYQWFPRACPHCVGQQALAALGDHCLACEPCSRPEPGHTCSTGAALLRLSIRRGR